MRFSKLKNFSGVYSAAGKLATKNLVPGFKSVNEEIIKTDDGEYRIWDPYKSKPSAAIKKGLQKFPLKDGMKILYLGMAEGKTVSFFSDIVGKKGVIFGVEISERSLRDSIHVCEKRGNIIPILADSRKPEIYDGIVFEKVDLVYEDVASPDQVQILIRNSEHFLKSDGFAVIAIKSQSIDSVKHPKDVYEKCLIDLEKHFQIIDQVELDPYEKNHLFVVMKQKNDT
jgi:fibrillarin-like pre-rRNA processing protein